MVKNADLVKLINDHYFKGCYQIRNIWMVDRSSRVIAVYNGAAGGTRNTVEYAKSVEIDDVILYDVMMVMPME